MNKIFIVFLFLSFFETLFCRNNNQGVKRVNPNDLSSPQNVIIAVNKPRMTIDDTLSEDYIHLGGAKQNEQHYIANTAEEILRIISENKNKLLAENTSKQYGFKTESEIINANDENVLNLLLINDEKESRTKERKFIPPVILVLPQHLSNQELFYYEKYKHLKEGLKNTKHLLLKVAYFKKLAEIKSKNKREAVKELVTTSKIIEQCTSRINIIKELLEEISIDSSAIEDENTKKLKNERAFLKQKKNVLVHFKK
ncbi:hypothetical protein, conserved [Plasmodium gonderi]|uniref:Uncharacterized protein n=1 Tax=Plasmodium gonderi TaxID=77519 RepID=A0A1Y1JQ10_PLAGO|nr:hypothetical protein, conserved [Plasmodium gonderi]GAW83588.1 hypothetical protein, conserved [Plasmodium gonderi]